MSESLCPHCQTTSTALPDWQAASQKHQDRMAAANGAGCGSVPAAVRNELREATVKLERRRACSEGHSE